MHLSLVGADAAGLVATGGSSVNLKTGPVPGADNTAEFQLPKRLGDRVGSNIIVRCQATYTRQAIAGPQFTGVDGEMNLVDDLLEDGNGKTGIDGQFHKSATLEYLYHADDTEGRGLMLCPHRLARQSGRAK